MSNKKNRPIIVSLASLIASIYSLTYFSSLETEHWIIEGTMVILTLTAGAATIGLIIGLVLRNNP